MTQSFGTSFVGIPGEARRPPWWRRFMATSSDGMAMGNVSLIGAVRYAAQQRRRGHTVTISRLRPVQPQAR